MGDTLKLLGKCRQSASRLQPASPDPWKTSELAVHLHPIHQIHSQVRSLFGLLTVLSVVLLVTIGSRLISQESMRILDVMWMACFALACLVITVAEIHCLRYIRESARPQMASLVLRDELTSLFNRRYMADRLDEEITRSRRHHRRFAVVYFDLNGFKQVNDQWGHDVGDEVLRQAAQCLRDNMRREDILCRLGGDEFLALLPDTSPSEALNLVIRLHTTFSKEAFKTPSGQPVGELSFSAGVAYFPDDGKDRETLVSVADRNMYEHKLSGARAAAI
jgi:diguanylate cyclase (GGDEF)-like protein